MLDFGGGTFAPLAELPHVGGVGDPVRARRRTADRRRGAASSTARGVLPRQRHRLDRDLPQPARRRAGPTTRYGDVFLVVDGWSTLRADFDEASSRSCSDWPQRGLTFGIHLLVAPPAGPTSAPPCATSSAPGSSCGSATRSTPRSTARSPANVPTGRPGRGLMAERLHFLGALPRVDGDAGPATLGDGVEDLVAVSARGRLARPRRPAAAAERDRLDRGRGGPAGEAARGDARHRRGRPAPVGLDFDREPHLLSSATASSRQERAAAQPGQSIIRRSPRRRPDHRRRLPAQLLGEVPRTT